MRHKAQHLAPLLSQFALPLGTTRGSPTAPGCASQNPAHPGLPHGSAPARNPGTKTETHPPRPQVGGGLKKHCQIHIASQQPAPDKGTPSRMPREVQTPTSSTGLLSPVPMAILRTPFHDNPWAGCAKEGALPPAGRGRPLVQPRWTTGSRASPKEPWNHRQTQRYPSRP